MQRVCIFKILLAATIGEQFKRSPPEESGLRGFKKEVPAEQVLRDIVVGVVGVEPYLITIKSRVPVR